MKRRLGFSLALLASLAPLAAAAADVPYAIFIDGRPVDARTPSGLSHRGVVFINVVRAVKTFDGLLTFAPGGLTRVTIAARTIDFRIGNRTAMSDGKPLRLPGAPFVENGDTYVPLSTIASLAGAKVAIDRTRHRFTLVLPEPPPPTPTPMATTASDDVQPSTSQALAVVTSGRADATGLHVRADITNRTAAPYTVSFPTSDHVAFLVSRNGTEVWSSTTAASAPEDARPSTIVLPARATQTFTATWTGFAAAGPGRYTLRTRLLTAPPIDETPISLGVTPPAT